MAGGKLCQAVTEAGDDVALQGARFRTFGFRAVALGFGQLALAVGFGFQALGVGELVAEAFQGFRDRAGFIRTVLAGDRLGIHTVAERRDVPDEAGKRLLHEEADREVEAEQHGAENDQAADDHHVGLVVDRAR